MVSYSKYEVWWIPQVPMEPFEFEVPNAKIGLIVCDALAKYDAFQFENNIKPDYSSTGGVRGYDSECDEWDEINEEDCI